MKRQIYKLIFLKLMGWKIIGTVDERVKKSVMMVVPHTSWHDFYLGVFSRGILDVEINWVGKKELFRFPLGWYFRYMGGAPLDRKGGKDTVEAIAQIFEDKEVFRLAIAPEGTRKKVNQLKTGFYYIALKANVPIIPVAFDFGKKEVRYGSLFYPTGDLENDIATLSNNFKDTIGKIPEYSFEVL
jgi:1-acyl-sn-glycerol-3-phosphate acyltransferase